MPQEASTMLVAIHLAALTRVEYHEILEVPRNLSLRDLDALLEQRYRDVDGGEFHDDPEYWGRSDSCRWEKITPETAFGAATGRVILGKNGRFKVEEIAPPAAASDAVAPAPEQAAISSQEVQDLRQQRDMLLRVYRSLQSRLKSIDRHGWAHDYDGELLAAGVKL